MKGLIVKNASYAADTKRLNDFFQLKQLRRLNNLQKLVLCAAAKVLAASDFSEKKEDIGLIIATGKGTVAETCAFMDGIIDDGDTLASPLAFSSSVHNALETVITALLNLQGICLTISDGAETFNTALITAYSLLNSEKCKEILLCAADEYNPVILKEYCEKISERPAAAAFLIAKEEQDARQTPPMFASSLAQEDKTKPQAKAMPMSNNFFYAFAAQQNSRMPDAKLRGKLFAGKSFAGKLFPSKLFAGKLFPSSPFIATAQTALDEINPSQAAFNFAREFSPFILKDEASLIVCDYIKTYLAGNRSDILSVFENKSAKDMLENAPKDKLPKIYEGLKLLCSLNGSFDCAISEIENVCLKAFNKSNEINFFTSGSTGVPKNCIHSKAMINEEVESLLFLFRDIERIITTVPAHHSYGFIFGLQTPRFLDVAVKQRIPVPFLEWADILRENDLLVTFPLFLKYLMELDFKFPKGVTILTSTAPCPDKLIEKIYKNGAKRLIEIYGASEAGAIAYRETAFAPFKLLPCWDIDKDGKTIIRKRTRLKVEMPDIISFESQRVFRINGRKDKAAQVAGVNVYPSKVADILKQNALVKDAEVRLGGERLKAFIVLKDGIDEQTAKKELRKYMETTLTAHEMPKSVSFGGKIPITPFGKKTDW